MRTPTILLVLGFLLIFAAPSALAVTPPAPSVVTGAAGQVTGKSATLSGTVTSNGSHTTYTFQYGTTPSYGFQTHVQDAGPNAVNRTVYAHLGRLVPGTAYHYRLVATNGAGMTEGADQTFTTTAVALATVVTGAAGQVTGKSATLSGTLSSNGSSTTYMFQYGATTAYGLQTHVEDAGPDTVNRTVYAHLGGLAPGTAYHYRLVATNGAGMTEGADQTFTTVAVALPTVVTGAAGQVTGKSATLSGTLSSNGSRATYMFQYGATTAYGLQTHMQEAGPNAVSRAVYAHLGQLTPGTVYHFRLVATNNAGTATGSDGTFTTVAVALPNVATGTASRVSGKSALLNGTLSSNGSRATYMFQYGTTTAYGLQTHMQEAGPNAVNRAVYAHLGRLTPGTAYHFRLVATNNAGTATGSDQTFTTAAVALPSVATGTASHVSGKSALLSGTLSSNGSRTRYRFQYGTTAAYGLHTHVEYAGPNAVNRTVYAHLRRLTPGTTYHFRLVATNNAGTATGGDQTFTTAAVALPSVATGTASHVSGKSALLSGTLSSNGSRTRYTFQYGTTAAYGLHTHVEYAGPNAVNRAVYAHLGRLTPGTTYHFRLIATNNAGTATGGDQTFTTAAVALPSVTTGTASHVSGKSALLSGTLSSNGSRTRYRFQYGTTAAYGLHIHVEDVGPNAVNRTVYAHLRRLTPGTAYHFRLIATNNAGTATGGDQTFTTAAVAPRSYKVWFAGSVADVGTSSLTVNVLWTGPHAGSLNGQSLNVSVLPNTRIQRGKHHRPIALASIRVNDLVAIRAATDDDSSFSATGVHVYCNCHWIGGTISSVALAGGSLKVHVDRSGPYDRILRHHEVTLQVNENTVYLRGRHDRRIPFGSLRVGDGVGVVFAASGFFKAPSFNPSTATFTAKRVHVWNRRQVPDPVSDALAAAGTSATG